MKNITKAIKPAQQVIANKMDAPMKTNGNWFHNDIVLNVGFAESLKRGLISIMIPLPLLFINHVLLIYAAPVMFYLFVTALTHFCFFRYIWEHLIHHFPVPEKCDFAVDLNIPVKAI